MNIWAFLSLIIKKMKVILISRATVVNVSSCKFWLSQNEEGGNNSFYWKISHSKCVDNDDDDAANETTRCWAYVQKRSFSISLQQTIVYLDNIRPYWWHMHNEKWNQDSLYHLGIHFLVYFLWCSQSLKINQTVSFDNDYFCNCSIITTK